MYGHPFGVNDRVIQFVVFSDRKTISLINVFPGNHILTILPVRDQVNAVNGETAKWLRIRCGRKADFKVDAGSNFGLTETTGIAKSSEIRGIEPIIPMITETVCQAVDFSKYV